MGKNSKFLYNLKGISRYYFEPFLRPFLDKNAILKGWENRADAEYIKNRVDYYNKLGDSRESLDSDSRKQYSHITTMKDFKIPRKRTVYFFDSFEFLRYFPRDLRFILESGDVNYVCKFPSLCKSRPVRENNANNVILNLEKVRHFAFFKDSREFSQKDNTLFWRGGVYQSHRIDFMQKYFGAEFCDLGHVGSVSDDNRAFIAPKASIEEHLRHKFILSLEGNDVATNLKWIMNSNSLAIMPTPRFETWFMEGRLEAGIHYIKIKDDFSDVCEVLETYKRDKGACEEIRRNANAWCAQFFDKKREAIISLLVLEKYFKNARF